MIQWKAKKPDPQPPAKYSVLNHGPIRISVGLASGEAGERQEIWQYFTLMIGNHTTRSHDECLELFPHEVIQRAHEALDQFKATLDEEGSP